MPPEGPYFEELSTAARSTSELSFLVDPASQTALAATIGQQATVAGTRTVTGPVLPTGNVSVLNPQQGEQQ